VLAADLEVGQSRGHAFDALYGMPEAHGRPGRVSTPLGLLVCDVCRVLLWSYRVVCVVVGRHQPEIFSPVDSLGLALFRSMALTHSSIAT
jgi:hypothetical protein